MNDLSDQCVRAELVAQIFTNIVARGTRSSFEVRSLGQLVYPTIDIVLVVPFHNVTAKFSMSTSGIANTGVIPGGSLHSWTSSDTRLSSMPPCSLLREIFSLLILLTTRRTIYVQHSNRAVGCQRRYDMSPDICTYGLSPKSTTTPALLGDLGGLVRRRTLLATLSPHISALGSVHWVNGKFESYFLAAGGPTIRTWPRTLRRSHPKQ